MPAKSKAQQRLMAAAEHGASVPMAQQVRQSMTMGQLADYASGSMTGKPERVAKPKNPNWRPEHNLGKYAHKPKGR